MKKSISKKLFFFICIFSFVITISSWLISKTLLKGYYVNQKMQLLLKNSISVDSKYTGDPKAIEAELQEIENTTGCYIFILNDKDNLKYNTFFAPPERLKFPPPHDLALPLPGELPRGRYELSIRVKDDLNTEFFSFKYVLNNNDVIQYITPMAVIRQSVNIASNFTLITGVIIIFFGAVFAFLFSKSFTKPIKEISSIAREIAHMDFSKKCEINSQDELGELSQSINYLSFKLEESIEKLNIENKNLEEEVQKEKRLEKMRKEFISSVSHELKTPLSIIAGYAEGLRLNVCNDEENRAFYCDVILDEISKMNRLVADLLKLSHFESGLFTLEKEEFSLDELILRIKDKYNNLFEDRGIDFSIDTDSEYTVFADRMRIEQVIANYINNAIEHVDNNNKIVITVNQNEDRVRVSVYNSGEHIPCDKLEKIWSRFYKIDDSRTRTIGGSGLGLSIVKAIVLLHEGEYGALNVSGGVLFWFELFQNTSNVQSDDTKLSQTLSIIKP